MNILGISAFYHDSAAAILKDGEILAANQEERYTRKKQDHNFPIKSVEACFKQTGLTIKDIDYVAFYDKPFVKFNRLLETYLAFPGQGIQSFLMAAPLWLKQKLWIPDIIKSELNYDGKILFPEHHESHAASAFFPSPYEKAAFLTIDGVGEWACSSYGMAEGNRVKILGEMHFPHSPGLLYSAITYFTGFKVNSGEYKIMGLAPYGNPIYVDKILNELIDLKEDGSFRINLDYFDFATGLKMSSKKMEKLFGGPARVPETNLTQREMDLARSVQDVTEEIMLRMARHVKKETNADYLCLAGGVALNCVANGKLLRENIFKDIWIQPAAGDAGGALGAAYIAYHHHLNNPVKPKSVSENRQKGSYLGSEYSNEEIKKFMDAVGAKGKYLEKEELLTNCVDLMTNDKVLGWFQGRMEFGPRALGNRSIVGDARSKSMQKNMNLKIKFREGFRPFAPSVMADKVSEWFDIDRESPYMLLVADVKKDKQREMTEDEKKLWGIDILNIIRSEIPAVTHVDYSARLQTVNRMDNEWYYDLINKFYNVTGCPVIVNTSFNVRGEPIVESPKDAYVCFMRTGIDALVLGNYLLMKEEQPELDDKIDWRKEYELD